MLPLLVPLGPIDWLTTKAGQWFHDTAQAATGWVMDKVEFWRQVISDNLNQPSFSLLEQKWFNDIFSEVYGWLILIVFALPTLIGIIVIIRVRTSRRAAGMASDAVGVGFFAIVVTLALNLLVWLFNTFHTALINATGADTMAWLTTLTPPVESFWLQLLYLVELVLGGVLVLANEYFVPLFILLGLIAWAFRSWGTHRTQQFFTRVIAFGVASLFTKLIYSGALALGNKIAQGKDVNAQALIGALTLAVAFGLCVAAFVGGTIVATKLLDGKTEVSGRVAAEMDDRLSVEGDVNVDMASMFSFNAGNQPANANERRLASSQGDLVGTAMNMATGSDMVKSLMKMDHIQAINGVLDVIPDQVITAAGAAAGVPQAGAINAVRRDLADRVYKQPD